MQSAPTLAGGWIGKGVIRSRRTMLWCWALPTSTGVVHRQRPHLGERVELGYQFQLGSNVSVQPNLQYVFNPMGRGRVEDPLVMGLQLSLLL